MARDKTDGLKVETFEAHQVITQPNPLRKYVRHTDERDTDDPVARAEEALAGLSGEFKSWMDEECARLARAFEVVKKDGFTSQNREELFRAAHDIKGDATTFGYPKAAVAAESLCRILEHAPELMTVPSDLIAHHVHAIQAIVRELPKGRSRTKDTADELSTRLRKLADEFLIEANRDRPEHLEAVLAPSIVPAD
ncbi:Hpt domain-containing protein [[Pseudomonas] carboxydohydrogena]|uniref:Hpt domain-containing protein n=1 Tax=Afipia carboxydohydrogena TaxID=290 RepID=A0ABY8BS41_AFICR|nr:Hpt domain-containing protein [[Pseudomonas] carboxydohydrogena]WEF52788.1 Hpt domain-containing protein [[Pseudomonas] carboxydohydrogena]